MLGKWQKLQYSLVDDNLDEDEAITTVDFEPMKRRFCSPVCVRKSLFTCILIGAYYVPSVGLTLYQRWLLQSFEFPLFTVLVHMTVKFLLAFLVREVQFHRKKRERPKLECRDHIVQIASSGVFSGIDIGFSNWALALFTVSLYTMTKSTTIVFILFFSIVFKLEKPTWSLCGIVGLITTGLFLFTHKATQFNIVGFLLILMASVASGLRWTCVQLMLQKSKIGMRNPVDMIFYMQPWMILALVPVALWVEGPKFLTHYHRQDFGDSAVIVSTGSKLLLGAFIAFFMEFSEVTLVTYTSSLTLAIAGIFKDAVTVTLGVLMFGDMMSLTNTVGLIICLGGIGTHVLHKMKSVSARSTTWQDFESDRTDLNEKLILKESLRLDSDSDGEKSDSQVLFDILNRHDR